jgi:hypothetical protein
VSESSARYGWQSDLPAFVQASPAAIEAALLQFLQGASSQQITSWHDCIRWLQREYDRCVREEPAAERYFTLLEYELPRDFRRPDIIVLEGGTVVVLEVKGRAGATRRPVIRSRGTPGIFRPITAPAPIGQCCRWSFRRTARRNRW